MNRVLAVARMHLVNPLLTVGIPWGITALSFAINLAVWGLTDAGAQPGGGFTGGVLTLYVTVLVIYVQSVTQLLPFAMGVSLSRRTFYLGTALVAVLQSLTYGVVLSALVAVEDGTGGWGVGLSYFAPAGLDVDNAALQVLVSGVPLLAFAVLGTGIGVVSKRWGPAGVWYLITASLVLFGGLAILVSWLRAWGDVGGWLVDRSVVTLAVGLPIVLTVVVGAMAFAGLRRVVP
jgi:hypothetical protein